MIKTYLGNETYEITLTSGTEITLNLRDWEELILGAEIVEELKAEVINLEGQILEFEEENNSLKHELERVKNDTEREDFESDS